MYSGEADDASDSGSEFGIDSDVSDAELLELQRDLKKLDPKKMQRNLADATIACQASTMKRWERYCLPPLSLSLSLSLLLSLSLSLSLFVSPLSSGPNLSAFQECGRSPLTGCLSPGLSYCAVLRKDPVKLLKKCDAAAIQGYLIWYHKHHPRARRLNTFESHWKGLRQLYYDTTWKVVDEHVGKLVTTVSLLATPSHSMCCD